LDRYDDFNFKTIDQEIQDENKSDFYKEINKENNQMDGDMEGERCIINSNNEYYENNQNNSNFIN
jgi:hypothetical protein